MISPEPRILILMVVISQFEKNIYVSSNTNVPTSKERVEFTSDIPEVEGYKYFDKEKDIFINSGGIYHNSRSNGKKKRNRNKVLDEIIESIGDIKPRNLREAKAFTNHLFEMINSIANNRDDLRKRLKIIEHNNTKLQDANYIINYKYKKITSLEPFHKGPLGPIDCIIILQNYVKERERYAAEQFPMPASVQEYEAKMKELKMEPHPNVKGAIEGEIGPTIIWPNDFNVELMEIIDKKVTRAFTFWLWIFQVSTRSTFVRNIKNAAEERRIGIKELCSGLAGFTYGIYIYTGFHSKSVGGSTFGLYIYERDREHIPPEHYTKQQFRESIKNIADQYPIVDAAEFLIEEFFRPIE